MRHNEAAGTMVACPQGMDTENAFFDGLRQASTFKIAQQHQELFDAAGQLVARFEAR
jgi:heat shock protein HslJ